MIRKAEKHRADEMFYQETEDAQKKLKLFKTRTDLSVYLDAICTGLGNQYFY